MVSPEATAEPDSGLTGCPSVQELSRLLDEPSADTDLLAAHVETCAICQLKLEELTGDADEMRLPKSQMPEYLSSLASQLASESVHATSELPTFTLPGFEILECVGRGGMGAVYRARHQQLDREVAVKVIAAGAHAGPEYRARLDREGRLVAKLDHAHIVRIFDSGHHDNLPYLVLEFMDSGSLAERRSQLRDPLEIARLLEILSRAVHAAHDVGIVHRDLKPGNVLLTRAASDDEAIRMAGESFTPRIADFGLSKQMLHQQEASHSAGMLGTPGYMAPEQATESGSEIGPATDVHALGIMLYELLAGHRPFEGRTTLATIDQIRSQPAPDLLTKRADIPPALADICHQCLQKRPADRYESALQLADELRRFCAGETLRHTQMRRKKVRGKPALWMALTAAAVLLFSVFRVQTNHGTVVIDTDGFVDIEIRRNDRMVETLQVRGTAESRRVYAGDIEIVIPAELKDRYSVANARFRLTRNGREVVTIRHIPEPVITGGDRAPQPGAPQREFAEWFLRQDGILRLHGEPGDFHTVEELPEGDIRIQYVLDRGKMLSDEHLPLIASLPDITMIQVGSKELTGRSLAALNEVSNLSYLSLAGCPVNDENFSSFDNFENLADLSIPGTQISSSFIPRLAKCKNLGVLSATEQQILHPQGIEFLKDIDSLYCVGIHDFTDASAELLSGLPSLRQLYFYDGHAVSQATLDAVCRNRNLRRLKFWNTDLSDVDFSGLSQLDDLVWLELRNVNLPPTRIAEIAQSLPNCDIMHSVEHDIEALVEKAGGTANARRIARRQTKHPTFYFDREIESITFDQAPLLRDEHFIPYQHLQHLKSLTVNRAGIDGSTLKHISHLKSLERLSLAETQISDRHIDFLSQLTGLKSLNLCDTKVTARGLSTIAALKDLESLSVDGLQITPATLAMLAELPRLRELKLARASNTTLAQIASLQQLEHLTVDESFTVTQACLPALAGLKNLQTLTLGKTNIPSADLQDLKTQMPKCEVTTIPTQDQSLRR